MRALLNKALTLAIEDRSFDAIKDILRYGSKKLLTYRIQLEDLEHLIRHEAYSTINTLVSASVQIERPNSDQAVTLKTGKQGEQDKPAAVKISRSTLSLSEVISHCTEMSLKKSE